MQNIRDPKRDTREKVRLMTEDGLTVRQIARALDVSTERVYQLLRALGMKPAGAATTKEAPADNGGSPRARDGSRTKSTA